MSAVRILGAADAEAFRDVRLRGLRECPAAFASSFEEESALGASEFAAWLDPLEGRAIFGAFDGAALIGCAGLRREGKAKLAHKGFLWGMYVAPGFRGRGIGKALVAEALRFAASLAGVRQVNLGVSGGNAAAIRLYESAGFRRYGVEPEALCVDGLFHSEIHMAIKFKEEGKP